MVHVLLPVGVVVEYVVVVVGIVVEEGCVHVVRVAPVLFAEILYGAGQFTQVGAVLVTIHHVEFLGYELHTAEDAHVDLGGHGASALCLDDDDAVGTLGTIEGRRILQHLYAFHVFRVETRKDVVVESLVERGAFVLRVDDVAVQHDEGLGVGIDAVHTADGQVGTLTEHTAAAGAAHIACQVVLNLRLHGDAAGLVYLLAAAAGDGGAIGVVAAQLGTDEACVLACLALDG